MEFVKPSVNSNQKKKPIVNWALKCLGNVVRDYDRTWGQRT